MTGRSVAEIDPASPVANDAESAKKRLLDAATQLFCRYGTNATGVDAVIDEARTAKTTLYRIFGSKEGLIEAVLENEGRRWREWFPCSRAAPLSGWTPAAALPCRSRRSWACGFHGSCWRGTRSSPGWPRPPLARLRSQPPVHSDIAAFRHCAVPTRRSLRQKVGAEGDAVSQAQ